MIYRSLILLFSVSILSGCFFSKPDHEKVIVKIDNITVTKADFDKEFADSVYSNQDTPESREAFLDYLISKKLILREAQRNKLDRDPEFPDSVEIFWQQSLMKIMLDKQNKEFAINTNELRKQAKRYYDRHKSQEFPDKDFSQVESQIQWLLLREKKQKAIDSWLDSLRTQSNVKVNKKLIA